MTGRRYPSDNALNRLDEVYLGPKGYTLPWRARGRAYGLGFAIFVVVVPLLCTFLPLLVAIVWGLVVTILATTALMRNVTPDVPFRSKVSTLVGEFRTPRPRRADEGSCRWPTIR